MKTKITTEPKKRRHKLTENLSYKFIALALALLLWYIANDPQQMVDNFFSDTFRIFQTDTIE